MKYSSDDHSFSAFNDFSVKGPAGVSLPYDYFVDNYICGAMPICTFGGQFREYNDQGPSQTECQSYAIKLAIIKMNQSEEN